MPHKKAVFESIKMDFGVAKNVSCKVAFTAFKMNLKFLQNILYFFRRLF